MERKLISPSDNPFDTPEKAYVEAERQILKAKRTKAKVLAINLEALRELPRAIASLSELEDLSLSNTQVADLEPIGKLHQLKRLDLAGTQVVDLSPLIDLKELNYLHILKTNVSDLAPLVGLRSLQRIFLSLTRVNDLSPLIELTRLECVVISDEQLIRGYAISQLTQLSNAAQEAMQAPPGIMPKGLYVFGDELPDPFSLIEGLSSPAATVETINYLRRRDGLPEHFPAGYIRPEGFVPPDPRDYADKGWSPVPPAPPLPEQGKAIRFIVPREGPIDLDCGTVLEERNRLGGMQSELLEAAQELREFAPKSNGYQSLIPTLDKYIAALDRPMSDLRDGDIEIVYARGLRLQANYDDLKLAIESGDVQPGDRRLFAPMQVLLGLHGPFVQATNRGAELYDHAERDQRTRKEELEYKEKQQCLNAKLRQEAPALMTDAAFEEIDAATEIISRGLHEERASSFGRNINRNSLIGLTDMARRWHGQGFNPANVTASFIGGIAANNTATLIWVAARATELGLGTGNVLSAVCADFLVRHAKDYRDLARLGGASFNWLIVQLDWLESAWSNAR